MKTKLICFLAALLAVRTVALAQGTAFTYQGRFTDNGAPHTGSAEFQATLWDAVSGGSQTAANSPPQVAVGVTNGLFVLPLDFGANFPGADRWLQLEVRTTDGPFTTLAPRQPLTAAPYAITAGNLTGPLPAAQLSGPVASTNLAGTYSSALTLNNAANRFSGVAAGLTGLDASQLASGTVPDTRLAGNVARTDQVWQLGGNAGTTSATHFLGTTDDQPLELMVHGMRALRLQSSFLPYLNSVGPSIAVNLIAGSHSNSIGAGTFGAVIGGGGATNVTQMVPVGSEFAISHDPRPDDGLFNQVGPSAHFSSIVGGAGNSILSNSWVSAIGGGGDNRIGPDGNGSVIAGGAGNIIAGSKLSSIGGGLFNKIGTADSATISGGWQNVITGKHATIPGGLENSATNHAFAAGTGAKANHTGAFVWSDAGLPGPFGTWSGAPFASTGPNQFCIRASGGVQLNGNTPMFFGSTLSQKINLYGTTFGIGIQSGVQYYRVATGGAHAWFAGGVHNDGTYHAGGGAILMRLDGNGNLFTTGAVNPPSDRNDKENFVPVQPREMLEKVLALPLSSWNYKADTVSRHVGPMAQDFHAAFNLGADDKHIATVDADGVALAAIQGLNQRLTDALKRQDAEIAELKSRLEQLEQWMNPENGGAR